MAQKILVLPDAGLVNPFQTQLIGFLRENGCNVVVAPSGRFFATLRAYLKYRPDVVYFDWVQSFVLGKTWAATLLKCFCFWIEILYLAKIERIPMLHTLHNMRNHSGLWRKTENTIYRFFLTNCEWIRVYSDTTRTKCARYFGIDKSKIVVIQDVPFHYCYPNRVSRSEGRVHVGVDQKSFVYLFFGMIKPYKGIEHLIDTFEKLHDTPSAWLVIAGVGDDPEYEAAIKRRINNIRKIVFVNRFVPIEQTQYFFKAADAVVLPFKSIEHSGSIELAMSFGKAVITRRTLSTEELLSRQRHLLFTERQTSLLDAMLAAKMADTDKIGKENFTIVDNTNFRQLLPFFRRELLSL